MTEDQKDSQEPGKIDSKKEEKTGPVFRIAEKKEIPLEVSKGTADPVGPRQAFRSISRQLTEEDIKNPSVARLILSDADRLERENEELRPFRSFYHEVDKECAVLKEKIKNLTSIELFSKVTLTFGALLIGLSINLWKFGPSGPIVLAIGCILLVAGIVKGVVKK